MSIAATYPVAASVDPVVLETAGYRAEISDSLYAKRAALRLRCERYRHGLASDEDAFETVSLHGVVMVNGRANTAFRARLLWSPSEIDQSYTAQWYGLGPLHDCAKPLLEIGRLCQTGDGFDPMALRLAWAALWQLVDHHKLAMIIGCTSLPGADVTRHAVNLNHLGAHHLGPKSLLPRRLSRHAVSFPSDVQGTPHLPPLLLSYLKSGGWVGDHAVQDAALNTTHLFTGLITSDMPLAKQRRLRDIAEATRLDP